MSNKDKYGEGLFIWECTEEQKRNRTIHHKRYDNIIAFLTVLLFVVAYITALLIG